MEPCLISSETFQNIVDFNIDKIFWHSFLIGQVFYGIYARFYQYFPPKFWSINKSLGHDLSWVSGMNGYVCCSGSRMTSEGESFNHYPIQTLPGCLLSMSCYSVALQPNKLELIMHICTHWEILVSVERSTSIVQSDSAFVWIMKITVHSIKVKKFRLFYTENYNVYDN